MVRSFLTWSILGLSVALIASCGSSGKGNGGDPAPGMSGGNGTGGNGTGGNDTGGNDTGGNDTGGNGTGGNGTGGNGTGGNGTGGDSSGGTAGAGSGGGSATDACLQRCRGRTQECGLVIASSRCAALCATAPNESTLECILGPELAGTDAEKFAACTEVRKALHEPMPCGHDVPAPPLLSPNIAAADRFNYTGVIPVHYTDSEPSAQDGSCPEGKETVLPFGAGQTCATPCTNDEECPANSFCLGWRENLVQMSSFCAQRFTTNLWATAIGMVDYRCEQCLESACWSHVTAAIAASPTDVASFRSCMQACDLEGAACGELCLADAPSLSPVLDELANCAAAEGCSGAESCKGYADGSWLDTYEGYTNPSPWGSWPNFGCSACVDALYPAEVARYAPGRGDTVTMGSFTIMTPGAAFDCTNSCELFNQTCTCNDAGPGSTVVNSPCARRTDIVTNTGHLCRGFGDFCAPACNREPVSANDDVCGNNGCNGSCGECPADTECIDSNYNYCFSDACVPSCGSRVCGSDGCEGSCGSCNADESCPGGHCIPDGPDSGSGGSGGTGSTNPVGNSNGCTVAPCASVRAEYSPDGFCADFTYNPLYTNHCAYPVACIICFRNRANGRYDECYQASVAPGVVDGERDSDFSCSYRTNGQALHTCTGNFEEVWSCEQWLRNYP